MDVILWFSQIRKEMINEVGGKGANLGEMLSLGLPVPNGFCVTSSAYFEFIRYNRIDDAIKENTENLNVRDTRALNEASEIIKGRILAGEIPQRIREEVITAYNSLRKNGDDVYVAVRSSATAEDLPTASFAGQQASFLNVIGGAEVMQAVKECWASLFEARAIYYRQENGFDHLRVGLCAVVQEMVQSEVAGVLFSVDPITARRDWISIEAAYGLGEVVVSGAITPDRYIVSKKERRIVEKKVAVQDWMIIKRNGRNERVDVEATKKAVQKLTDKQILELAQLAVIIEDHYKKPQDIEWAYMNDKAYIVQSRPITTLKDIIEEEEGVTKSAAAPSSLQEERKDTGALKTKLTDAKIIVRGLGAAPGIGKGNVRHVPTPKDIVKMKNGEILVTEMTTPDFVPAMKKASAIITDTGGMTCHAAIVSREMGIPCIVGSGNATKVLKEGQFVTVDASHGIVYDGDVDIEERKAAKRGAEEQFSASHQIVTGTKIYVNLAEAELAEKVASMPCDGVGLLRAEFMMAEIGEHPKKMLKEGRGEEYINKLAEKMRIFASAFYPRPVVYRASDFKTNEYRNLKGGEEFEPVEANPMMGYRGCARYIKEPEVFKLELYALKKVRDEYGLKNLWLMIPFVRRIGEIRAIRDMLREVGIHRTRDFKLWIMCEVPSTVLLIDDFCKEGIDGVSIGSNDLTQLILGLDRDNATVSDIFDERNHAVLKSIEHVIKVCSKHGVTSSLCGQAPSVYPEFAEKLIEYGITSISVNPDALEIVRRNVASAEKKIMLRRLAKIAEGVEHKSSVEHTD
ncbi:MAG: phosphoenolpyruvate synthase [Candidatus Anstonellales archaeon]